jgi:hypothetical protein
VKNTRGWFSRKIVLGSLMITRKMRKELEIMPLMLS